MVNDELIGENYKFFGVAEETLIAARINIFLKPTENIFYSSRKKLHLIKSSVNNGKDLNYRNGKLAEYLLKWMENRSSSSSR